MHYHLKVTAVTSLGDFSGNLSPDATDKREDLVTAKEWIQTNALDYMVLHTVTSTGAPLELRFGANVLANSILSFEIVDVPQVASA